MCVCVVFNLTGRVLRNSLTSLLRITLYLGLSINAFLNYNAKLQKVFHIWKYLRAKKSPKSEPRGYMSGNEPVESGGDVSALFYPYQAAFSGVKSAEGELGTF